MVDEKQIRQWLKDGTITQAQAKKMLADSTREDSEGKLNKFIAVVATIGAVLIFIGFAWLIAKNWHQIPDAIKVLILVGATLGAFVSGVMLRQNNHEGVGRSLITLGALLYIASVFLIAQIYATPSGLQGYAWLLLLCWPVIMLTAYFLDSKDNLVISMITFFPWVIVQYLSSISKLSFDSPGGLIFSFILIFLGAGALLYGLSVFHNSIKHKFTNIYRFWTVFYFLLIFYILSFQLSLSVLSEYSFEGGAFSVFFVLFIILCFFGFIAGALFATSKNSVSMKEIAGFLGVLAVLFLLILLTKAGAGLMGTCYAKNCYEFKTAQECISAPSVLQCQPGRCEDVNCWNLRSESDCNSQQSCQWNQNRCSNLQCYYLKTESECNSESSCQWSQNRCFIIICNNLKTESTCQNKGCNWNADYCMSTSQNPYSIGQECRNYNNQRDSCIENSLCKWQPSYGFGYYGFGPSYGFGYSSKRLPTSLWFLWIVNNLVFIGFIILILWYGQQVGSTKIVNIALFAFILDIISRYIGFWMDFKGYFAFSILAILGGLMLIVGAWQIPKWRRKLLEKTKQSEGFNR